MVFGVLFGELFGLHMPWPHLHRLAHLEHLLIFTVALGAAHLLLGWGQRLFVALELVKTVSHAISYARLTAFGLAALNAIQAARLQFVEFLSKFYEGGGRPYRPFGTERYAH